MSSKNFKVMEMVGKGSFASVYKVLRKTDGKVYAMKRVKINKMSRKEIQDTLNEVRFLASIRHANIVGFYEAFIENNDSELCIVMEFCGCGDLAQKVERYKRKRQYINEVKIWGYLIQALRALQVLHNNGICHRDLKAANTFLSEDGSIKIGDMNVSKQLKQGQLQTQIGTPYYMSPEIWNNKPYDERCDIWSLGCMIYELASLRPPFLGDSFAALKRSVVLGRFPPLPRVYSDSLQRVIGIMLRVNPKERPNTSQLLAMSDISSKADLMETEGFRQAENNGDNGLIGTIKVPSLLKKLNEALPKPCYPDAKSGKEDESRIPQGVAAAPKPPLPPGDLSNLRRPLAPLNSDRSAQQQPSVDVQPHPPMNGKGPPPRPPAGNPSRVQYHNRVW